MKLINQSWEWIQKPVLPLELIEKAGRTCYQSYDKASLGTAAAFVQKILRSGHESVLEHATATIKLITSRSVMAELTRHRLCSFSIESTRYVRYKTETAYSYDQTTGDRIPNYDIGMEFIRPVWWNEWDKTQQEIWIGNMIRAEIDYRDLLELGSRPEQAREVLPNSLKTEIVCTTNMREWRYIFKLRTGKKAHPQIRALMLDVLTGFWKKCPILFDDIRDTSLLDQKFKEEFGE